MKFRKSSRWTQEPYLQYWVYGPLSLLILGPLLVSGYILTMDMIFVPEIPFPEYVSNTYLTQLFLAIINLVLPSDVIQKILLSGGLWLMGIGMYRLVQFLQSQPKETWGALMAGVFYMINPYTYSRFMAGQYWLLLGYALVPFFVRVALRFLAKPDWRSTLELVLWAVAISMVSIHTVGLASLFMAVGLLISFWWYRHKPMHLQTLGKYSLIGLIVFVGLSSYWLLPLLMGTGKTAEMIAGFGIGDVEAFATLGGSPIGQLANVLRLQGFWMEARQLYFLPQDNVPAWGLVWIVTWVLIIAGGRALWRKGKRFETGILGVSAFIAILMSLSGIGGWLVTHVAIFGGFREPQKFVGLLALMYAIFLGAGVNRLIQKWQQRFGEMSAYGMRGAVLLLVIILTPNMFWGFGRQLHTGHYPADWFAMNQQLNRDTDNFQVLFLPWHLYMHFDFAGRIIANPADRFFDKPIIASDDPEFDKASRATSDRTTHYLSDEILPKAAQRTDLGTRLAPLGIKYILLAKETDFQKYDFLNQQKKLKLIHKSDTLMLYQNTAYES